MTDVKTELTNRLVTIDGPFPTATVEYVSWMEPTVPVNLVTADLSPKSFISTISVPWMHLRAGFLPNWC